LLAAININNNININQLHIQLSHTHSLTLSHTYTNDKMLKASLGTQHKADGSCRLTSSIYRPAYLLHV